MELRGVDVGGRRKKEEKKKMNEEIGFSMRFIEKGKS